MPFHIIPSQLSDKKAVRRASESAAMLTSLSSNSGRSGIKEMLQSSLSTTSQQQQHPPSIIVNDGAGRSRASSLSLIKKKLGTSVSKASSGAEHMSRGRSGSNDLQLVNSNISMAPTDVASIISSNYDFPNGERYEKPNKYLSSYLKTQGLTDPVRLSNHSKPLHKLFGSSRKNATGGNVEIYVSNNGNMLLLPYLSSKKFTRAVSEEEEVDDDDDDDEITELYDTDNTPSASSETRSNLAQNSTPLNRINHTFGVIVKLSHKQTLNPTVKLKFSSDCSIEWINGIPDQDSKKFHESYKVSKDLVWDLPMDRADCFIPFEDDSVVADDEAAVDDLKFLDDSESSNTNESGKLDNVIISATPSQELKKFETFNYKERANIDNSELDLDHEYQFSGHHQTRQFESGYYVFLLPILFPPIMPETIVSPLGKVSYTLSIKAQPVFGADLKPPQQALFSTSPLLTNKFLNSPLIPVSSPSSSMSYTLSESPNAKGRLFKNLKHVGDKKKDENVQEYQFELPVIRQPPPDSITTVNKSVYVNKIWNEALNYEITFPKKYVQMSSIDDDIINNFELKIKIMPLIKKIYMKRIKVNMIEKITYTSKNLKYEYDYGKEFALDKGVKERIIPLFEIKTKEKANSKNHALRSEVVKNCLDDNLLTTCYEDYKSSKKNGKVEDKQDEEESVAVINTVKVVCPLTFYVKNDEMIKNIKTNISGNGYDDSDNESITSLESNRPRSPSLISILSKSPIGNHSSSGTPKKDDANQQIKDKYGLYPDVSGFGNINIKHRLQICFRISKLELPNTVKPGDDPNKLHHYEVIIDTPIVLNSPFANDQTPPSYMESFMGNETHFQIKPIYQGLDEFDEADDDDPPPPPFEFNIGSPINGFDIQSEFNSNENELLLLSPHSVDDFRSSPIYSLSQQQQQPVLSQQLPLSHEQQLSNLAPTTIDELLVVGNKSNLSKLLLSNPSPPEYSKIDTAVKNGISDTEELDIGGENYINEDELLSHDSYNKRRIEIAKKKNNVLMRKIEDDLGDFSF